MTVRSDTDPDTLLAPAERRRGAAPRAFLHVYQPPFQRTLPAPIWFRTAQVQPEAAYPWHRHPWGEFVYSFSGVMEVQLAEHHYMVPPPYGIWLPPQVEHQGLNRPATCHCSLYVSASLCAALPAAPCALALSPLVRALLEHLKAQPPAQPQSPEDQRLLQVLVDQLAQAPRQGSYLPSSDDALLSPVLRALEADPADARSMAELAALVHTTERTLVRRAQRDLGMPLAEWRQRLRVVRALARLEAGDKVEAIALDLGYASASAFIAMFRKLVGSTPDEYRRRL